MEKLMSCNGNQVRAQEIMRVGSGIYCHIGHDKYAWFEAREFDAAEAPPPAERNSDTPSLYAKPIEVRPIITTWTGEKEKTDGEETISTDQSENEDSRTRIAD